MTSPAAPAHLTIGLDCVNTVAVAVDAAGQIVAKYSGSPHDSPRALLQSLVSVASANFSAISRVAVILPEFTAADIMVGTRVGILRIGFPATTLLPPLSTWPDDIRAALAGPTRMVSGGYEYDGRQSASLDVDSVRRFADNCLGQTAAAAVAAIHGLEHPEHEDLAASVITDRIGLDIGLICGHEIESPGLLQRENTSALNAVLEAQASELIGEITSAADELTPSAEVYVLRGDGTVLPAPEAGRHATAWAGAAHACLILGSVRLAEVDSATIIAANDTEITVGAARSGNVQMTSSVQEVAGIRTGVRRPRVAVISRRELDFADRLGAALDSAQSAAGGGPVIVVGDPPHGPYIPTDAHRVRRPEGDAVAAVGAATAEAAGSIDRVFWHGDSGRVGSMRRARELAIEAAVRAGADPLRLRVTPVHEALMTYVPVPAAHLQVTAAGPLQESVDVSVATS